MSSESYMLILVRDDRNKYFVQTQNEPVPSQQMNGSMFVVFILFHIFIIPSRADVFVQFELILMTGYIKD